MIAEARAAGAGAVFVPPQIASRGAHALAEALGVPTVRLDALAADLPAALGRAAACLVRRLRREEKTSARRDGKNRRLASPKTKR